MCVCDVSGSTMGVRCLALFLTLVVPSSAFTTVSQRNVLAIAHRSILTSRTSETLAELDPEAALAEPNVNAVLSVNTESMLDDVCVISEEGNECIEFPPALTAPQRVARALSFYSKVLPVLAAYKVQQVKLDLGVGAPAGGWTAEATAAAWNEIDEWGSTQIADTIKELRGFYVKTGQVISTRVDLFPPAYTTKLASLQDSLAPMPEGMVEAIVSQELLEGEPLDRLFQSFDAEPLGCASIAQVHKAVLLDGRVVAVKVQRPNVVPMLLGDIGNLKAFSLRLRSQLPVDYYTVFCELGRALEYELDFLHEAQAAEKIWAAVCHTIGGEPAAPSLVVPRPIPNLATRRVLVMDFIPGTPLSKLNEEMTKRGLSADSDEAKLLGRKLLVSLTEAYGRMIFGTGFIHGDPHPGNIFVLPGGREVALIDCGQVKQITSSFRTRLAAVVLLVADFLAASSGPSLSPEREQLVPQLAAAVRAFGVTFVPELGGTTPLPQNASPEEKSAYAARRQRAEDECGAATALLLFGTPDVDLPGGYSHVELSAESPIKQVLSFPQELVMLGRATVLIKGIASRLKVPWSLAEKWAPACRAALGQAPPSSSSSSSSAVNAPAKGREPRLPVWALGSANSFGTTSGTSTSTGAHAASSGSTAAAAGIGSAAGAVGGNAKVRSSDVRRALRSAGHVGAKWASGKAQRGAMRLYGVLPSAVQQPLKKRALRAAARKLERDAAKAAEKEV